MRKVCNFITCGLLLSVGWAQALAQEVATSTPIQRLKLELVDNRSSFDINGQTNTYTNTLRVNQPDGAYKFTAGLLKQGDNYITLTRTDNGGTSADVARINLKRTPQTYPDEFLAGLNFTSISSSASLDGNLPENWTSSGLYGNRNGYAYISGGSNYHLSYTVPADLNIHNAKIVVYIYTTTSGYFSVGDWIRSASANTWNRYIVTNASAGDVIRIQGITVSNNQYVYGQSPRITQIEIDWLEPMVPVFDVTTSMSTMGDNGWGDESTLGSTTAYSPNDVISLDQVNNVVDIFSVSTQSNAYPSSYSYMAAVDANVSFPTSGSESSFYACADYQNGDGTVEGIVVTGPNNWEYEFVGTQDDGTNCLWLPTYGNVLYTMPADFAGNSVNVTIIADSGTYGSGSMLVNGVSYTFSAGETHTWTVPIHANGTILFACDPEESYTADVTRIIISSGNGSSLSAPAFTANDNMRPRTLKRINDVVFDRRQLQPSETKAQCINSKNIN